MPEPIPFDDNKKKAGDPKSGPGPGRVYTNEEVSEIIRVALSSKESPDADSVTHGELIAIGQDFGLSAVELEEAFDRLSASRKVEEHAERAMLSFKVHGLVYGVVMVGLFLINALADRTFWWAFYPLVAWGTLLALHYIAARYIPTYITRLLEQAVVYSREAAGFDSSSLSGPARASFTIDDLYADLAEAKGIIELEGDRLHLEYQIADSIFGGIKSRVREESIPLSEIASVRLDKKLWCNKLTLQSNRLKTFDKLPGNKGGEFSLVFKGQSRQASERLTRQITEALRQGVT